MAEVNIAVKAGMWSRECKTSISMVRALYAAALSWCIPLNQGPSCSGLPQQAATFSVAQNGADAWAK